jgi:RNA recognition motif-containing protein
MKLFIGGFDKNVTEVDLRELFAKYGKVGKIKIWTAREYGKLRGFGYVELDNNWELATYKLDGKRWHGLRLEVWLARKQGW